jgi:pyruvate,water dikinase
VPGGFATTALAFDDFIAHNKLAGPIREALEKVDVGNMEDLAKTGARIRAWVSDGNIPSALENEIRGAFTRAAEGAEGASFAVRSSSSLSRLALLPGSMLRTKIASSPSRLEWKTMRSAAGKSQG